MAPPSPRRSSRARGAIPQSQQSSVSSSTSGRLERNTRSVNRPQSGKSTPSASLSSEPLDDTDDHLHGRRRKRGQEDESEKPILKDDSDMVNAPEDIQDEEDEAVRCICGSDDYPGRPPVDGPDANFFSSIELTEDVTGFFVQCDICKVWQHGACVGIFSAESSPDEYFCEQCRKDLHKIHTAGNGQKYSKYLPLHQISRATSRAVSISKDGPRSPKTGSAKSLRPNSASQTSKRRSTMNSRDAAYDDEQLRRAIEASREEVGQDLGDSSSRRTKRGRSNSEENSLNVKRQRTNSHSPSPPLEQHGMISRDVSDDEAISRPLPKKSRNGRVQEKSDKEDKERQRQEAASRRKGRADRRRTEDSELSEETPLAQAKVAVTKAIDLTSTTDGATTTLPMPGTPPMSHVSSTNSHKRVSRSNHKKGKNKPSFGKDRTADNEESPARSISRDLPRNGDDANVMGHSKSTSDQKHGTKSRSAMTSKMSMLDMKRRVAAIMDFISRTQVDLAAEAAFARNGNRVPNLDSPPPSAEIVPTSSGSLHFSNGEAKASALSELTDAKGFKDLSCVEMMDVLTRDMVKWQNQYA